jgi:hypothetical protein
MSRTVTVTWRDEAYGSLSGARCAFRLYDCIEFTDSALRRIHGKARKAGFTWNPDRCAWIAYKRAAAHRFIAGLQDLGYAVDHAGLWRELPSCPEAAS